MTRPRARLDARSIEPRPGRTGMTMTTGDSGKQNVGPGERVRVLLVEDHPLVGELVRSVCDDMPGFELAAEAASGARALEEANRVRPTLAIVDIGLPDVDGITLVRQLGQTEHPPSVLMLSAREDPEALLEAMAAGAAGYLAKSAGRERIREAIERVAAGGRAFTPDQEAAAVGRLASRARSASEASRVAESLTVRQRTILGMLALGRSGREIAAQLGISERSVRSHITTLYRRLGVSNRVEAVSRALSLGLVRREDPPHDRDLGSPDDVGST
jgi:DNA-binding NarL/FixJ family response regulator